MSCINCREDGVSYTLKTHVADPETQVELDFCSTDCLAEWVRPEERAPPA